MHVFEVRMMHFERGVCVGEMYLSMDRGVYMQWVQTVDLVLRLTTIMQVNFYFLQNQHIADRNI